MSRVLALLIVASVLPCSAAAGEGSPATVMEAHPLVYEREGEVHGCGVRLTGGEARAPASTWFDVSFNVFRRGIGIAQALAYELRPSELEADSRPERVPVQRTWLKAHSGSARFGENVERRDALIYTLLIEDVLALFEAIAVERPVSVGIRPWGDAVDSVYTGTPTLSDASRTAIGECLSALALE